jgi:hypothetical protein
LISWFHFFARCPVTEQKGATQRTLTQAPLSAFPRSTPSRAEWRLGSGKALKLAVSGQPRSQSYVNLVLWFAYIYFVPTLLFLRPSPEVSKIYFSQKRHIYCRGKGKISGARRESTALLSS